MIWWNQILFSTIESTVFFRGFWSKLGDSKTAPESLGDENKRSALAQPLAAAFASGGAGAQHWGKRLGPNLGKQDSGWAAARGTEVS